MPYSSHPCWFYIPNNTEWWIHVRKLFTLQLYPVILYLNSLNWKYLYTSALDHPQFVLFIYRKRQIIDIYFTSAFFMTALQSHKGLYFNRQHKSIIIALPMWIINSAFLWDLVILKLSSIVDASAFLFSPFLGYSLIQKTERLCSSETSVNFCYSA
jgi:hypothetical protein